MDSARMLYKYISFEQLVDMLQKQALTFVLPEVWEDPTEKRIFDNIIDKLENFYMKIQLEIYKGQTFCQCWTTNKESDAMWRIYSYNNRSIRIRANELDLLNLDSKLVSKTVTYTDEDFIIPSDLDPYSSDYGKRIGRILLDSLVRKRNAFSHENEVRLIYPLHMDGHGMSVRDYYIAYFAHFGDEEMTRELCAGKHTIDPANYSKVCKLLNTDKEKKTTKSISFLKCPDLIKGVMVHPLAPDWYVETVKTFCDKNSVPFDGKSKLYT